MSTTVPILPIHQITYTTERAVVTAADCISHLSVVPNDWSTEDPYWTLKQSAHPDHQAKVKEMISSGNISRNDQGLLHRIPGKLHMIKRPDTTGINYVFFREALPGEVPNSADVRLFKIGVGPLEVSLAFNFKTFGVTLQVFLEAPVLSTISIASVSGSLNDGLKIDVAYPDFLGGAMRLYKYSEGSKTYARLTWNVTVFGKKYEDTINVFQV